MTDTFTCELCGGTFDKAWSDEEADVECQEIFGCTSKTEDCCTVCDDCFKRIDPRQFKVA